MEEIKIKELGKIVSEITDILFKVIVIGEVGVGKTGIAQNILSKSITSNHTPTLTFDLLSNNYQIQDKNVCLQIWDTCGQEIYQALSSNLYKTAICAYLVYSIDNQKSFDNLDLWLKNLKANSEDDIQIFLIGNKSDSAKRVISYKQGDEYKNKHNLDYFIETSVQNNTNLKTLLDYTLEILFDMYVHSNKKIDNDKRQTNSTVSIKLRPSILSNISNNDILLSKQSCENETKVCNC